MLDEKDQFYLIAETLGGEKSVGEEALGVVICQPPPPFYKSFNDQISFFISVLLFHFLNISLRGYLPTTSSLATNDCMTRQFVFCRNILPGLEDLLPRACLHRSPSSLPDAPSCFG